MTEEPAPTGAAPGSDEEPVAQPLSSAEPPPAEAPPAPEPPPEPPPDPPRPITALAEGMTVAASNARPLRNASIYLGLLTVALAGPAVAVQMWFESLAARIPIDTPAGEEALGELMLRSGVLVMVAALGVLAVTIEGTAIGILLMAGRVAGRPVSLRTAVTRSRRVFWRLVRIGILVGIIEFVASLVWRFATNAGSLGDIEDFAVDPFVGTLVALPFLYANVAAVLADETARPAMRRSFRLVRRHKRLALALGLFALISGVVEGLALGSGFDLIIRAFEVLQLDLTAGGASLVIAFVLAIALVAAAGSLLFTVGAVVVAPQVVTWVRLREPLTGLPEELPETLPVERVEFTPAPSPVMAAPEPEPLAEPMIAAAEPVPDSEPPLDAPAVPPPPPDYSTSAWNRPTPFRWVTIQMRLVIAAIWAIAIVAFASGPPA